jgi:hypothetical protein
VGALDGKAILRFGDIELISCLALIPTEKIADSAAKLDFSRRSELPEGQKRFFERHPNGR